MDTPKPALENEAVNDRDLMLRVQNGDEPALAALMDRWELPTKAVIARLVLNASEAEDLAQEAFVRVWQQRDKFKAGAEFRPWLFAIAVNLARNRLRWWRRRPTVALQDWDNPTGSARGSEGAGSNDASGHPIASGLIAEQITGAVGLEQAERAAAVRAAIADLPNELREAIVLFEYEQMSQAEIAAVVGATAKAVETRIYRAREKLRTALRSLK